MPIYEYECDECKYSDEYIRSMDKSDLTPLCRACGSTTRKKVSFTGTVWAPNAGGMK